MTTNLTNFGLDLASVSMETSLYPETVPGRIAIIDGDFIAYHVQNDEDPFESAQLAEHHYRKSVGAAHSIVYTTVGPEKSYKYEQAIQKPYQANRNKLEHSPVIQKIKEYLGCQSSNEWEADDLVSAEAYFCREHNIDYVIVSPDKDLRMVPGKHYNFKTGCIDHVTKFGDIALVGNKLVGSGTKWFWAQMLMGDTCDGIQGLPWFVLEDGTKKRCGPVRTYGLLKNANTDWECFNIVLDAYRMYDEFKDYRTGEPVGHINVLWSEAKMLWMKRKLDINDFTAWIWEVTVTHENETNGCYCTSESVAEEAERNLPTVQN